MEILIGAFLGSLFGFCGALAIYFLSEFHKHDFKVAFTITLVGVLVTELNLNLNKAKVLMDKWYKGKFPFNFQNDPDFSSAFADFTIDHFLKTVDKTFISDSTLVTLTNCLSKIRIFNELFYRFYYFLKFEALKAQVLRVQNNYETAAFDNILEHVGEVTSLREVLRSKCEEISKLLESALSEITHSKLPEYNYWTFVFSKVRTRRSNPEASGL